MNKFLSIFLFCVFACVTSSAQVNIKVGYTGAYTKASKINGIITRFNSDEGPFPQKGISLQQKLNELHVLSGLELGIRYRIGISAFEISWSSISAESQAYGHDNGNSFEEKLSTAIRSYFITFDNFIGDFGFGATLATRKLKIYTDISGFDKNKQVFSNSGMSSRFHVFYQLKSNNISLTIKPYIEYPWGKLNVYGLEKEYFPKSPNPESDFDTEMTLFGISILFYNGPQR